MKRKHSGPLTLGRLYSRCICKPSGCKLWTGTLCSRGYPFVHDPMRHAAGLRATISGRRAAWEAKHGAPLPAGYRIVTSCRERTCLFAPHLIAMTIKDASAFAAAGGAFDTTKHRAARFANLLRMPNNRTMRAVPMAQSSVWAFAEAA